MVEHPFQMHNDQAIADKLAELGVDHHCVCTFEVFEGGESAYRLHIDLCPSFRCRVHYPATAALLRGPGRTLRRPTGVRADDPTLDPDEGADCG